VLVDSASDYLMGPAKILFGIPNTTLAEHAAIINSHSGENSTQEQQLIQHTNRTLSFGEKLIVGQYVAHYVRKYSPFTLPWNRKHILSDSQKENLENYQKQIPIFKEIVALHKINPICQTDLFEDKFTFINKTLTKLGRDIRKALKSNKITDTVFADIQNRMNRVEEVIREIAKQIGRPDTAITKRNMVSADLAQETVRRTLPNSNETSEFVMVDPTERFALQFSVMQQFWKQPDVVTHKFQELIVEDNKNTTLQLDN
jgi:hypothetical protein